MERPSVRQTARLFVALELPPAWRELLSTVQTAQERATPGYFRWVAPELMHLTVVFLGQVPLSRIDETAQLVGLAAAELPPFRLALEGTASFGSRRAPRVLYAEISESSGRLAELRRVVEARLRGAALPYDEKPLVPHVTLGRARKAGTLLQPLTPRALQAAPHTVRQVVLFESQLGPGGPVYTPRLTAALSAHQG